MKASTILRRLASFFGLCSVVDSAISWRRSSRSCSRFMAISSSRMASAPMPAVKLSSPNSSCALRYSSSDSSCTSLSEVRPGSIDDVVLEIEHALQILERHVEQKADARRKRLQEPDMRDGRGQLDVAHALAAHLGQRHFDAALFADDALILHPLVFSAQAFVVLDRTKNARAEKTVTLRLEGAVVDRLRLLDLAVGPGKYLLRACNRDSNLVECLHLMGRRDW